MGTRRDPCVYIARGATPGPLQKVDEETLVLLLADCSVTQSNALPTSALLCFCTLVLSSKCLADYLYSWLLYSLPVSTFVDWPSATFRRLLAFHTLQFRFCVTACCTSRAMCNAQGTHPLRSNCSTQETHMPHASRAAWFAKLKADQNRNKTSKQRHTKLLARTWQKRVRQKVRLRVGERVCESTPDIRAVSL